MRILILFRLRSNGWRRKDVWAQYHNVGPGQLSAVVARELNEAMELYGADADMDVEVRQ